MRLLYTSPPVTSLNVWEVSYPLNQAKSEGSHDQRVVEIQDVREI